jgi:hypothetical protein
MDDMAGRVDAANGREDESRVIRVAFLGTPLFAEPSDTSPKLAYLNKGTVLEVLGDEGEFLEVRMPGTGTGYLRKTSAARV